MNQIIPLMNFSNRLVGVARRFPVPALFAAATTFLLVWLVDDVSGAFYRWPLTAWIGFLAAFNWNLYSDSRHLSTGIFWTGVAAILGLLMLFFLLAPENYNHADTCFWYTSVGISLILHLGVSIVPFGQESIARSIVSYNVRTFLVWIQSFLFSSILISAVSLAVLGISMLFGWEPSPTMYPKLLILITGLFQTGYFLAEFPPLIDDSHVSSPRSVFRFLVIFAAVPITLVYGIIVHVYILSVVFSQNQMIDWYQTMALWFVGTGMFTWLLSLYFFDAQDHVLLRVFRKWFQSFCVLPLLALVWSLWYHFTNKGVQEDWYMSLFFTGLFTGSWLLSWRKEIQAVSLIPKWMMVVSAVAFFSGKYSLCRFPVIAEQQFIEETLTKNQIIRQGVLQRTNTSLQDTNGVITASLEYLESRHSLNFIRKFDRNKLLDSLPDTLRAVDLITFLHINKYNDFVDTRYWDYNRNQFDSLQISDFEALLPGIHQNFREQASNAAGYVVCLEDGNGLFVMGSDTIQRFDLSPLLRRMAVKPDSKSDTVVLAGNYVLRIIPQSANGKLEGKIITITGFSADVLMKKK